MIQTIKILPESLANKIAAGEVVQRPASAVKELVENAIDAHARSLSIFIKDGGRSLIHVIDDGDGMSKEDASIAFHRHATSKIAAYEDLECIRTLGFRGEALASIAAVSQVEMRTRMNQSDVGTKIRIEGGTVSEISDEACAVGTSIQVRNLFYNTPGRRNFVKSGNTEYRHIYDVVQRAAISHPELNLKFISNDETILDLRSESLQERIAQIFGIKLAESLICFEEKNDQIELSGFLGKPEYSKKGKTEQYLFLNKRYIVSRNLSYAVYQAYEHLLEKGSFPLFVLFITLDPRKVDVNVHPSKMEVKFEDEASIYRAVLSTIRKALSSSDLMPTLKIGDDDFSNARLQFQNRSIPSKPDARDWSQLFRGEKPPIEVTPKLKPEDDFSVDSTLKSGQESQLEVQLSAKRKAALWQIHNKYIILPVDNDLLIIDQHAAHERILYERARIRFTQEGKKSQQLLFPQTIQMSSSDAAIVKQTLPDLEKLGFTIKIFGQSTIIVDGVPPEIKPGKEGSIVQEIIDLFKEDEQQIRVEPSERLAKSFSCKAAVKAGDPLTDAEMESLIDQLFKTEIPYVCPHGRPVSIKLSLSELDRRFGRTS